MQNSAVERKRVVYPVSLSDRELKLLDVISEKTGASKAQAIREAIKAYADEIEGLEITKLRDISEAQAKKEDPFLSEETRPCSDERHCR